MEKAQSINQTISSPSRLQISLGDILDSFKSWRLWTTLGWHDIRLRYRRSMLGPLWITISMAVMIYTLGMVYSFLFKADITSYFPHLACGILIWNFFSSMTMEFVDGFVESAHLIKQIRLPFSTYILRILTRNFYIFLHNFLAVVPILIYYKAPVHPIAAVLGLALFMMIGFVYGMALAMLGSRYRDIKQLVQSLLQVIFYLTPIMWMPTMLPERFQILIKLNPVQQMIQLIRAPLLGEFPSFYTCSYTLGLFLAGGVLLLTLLRKGRHRIAFWV